MFMVDSGRIKDFWNSWQEQPTARAEFDRFRNRMLEVAKDIWGDYFVSYESNRKAYAIMSGTESSIHQYFNQSGLNKSLEQAMTVVDVVFAMQCLLWTFEEEIPSSLEYCCRRMQKALELSPTVMVRLARHGNTATFYPAGARLLDQAVVESNLIWLARYPEVLKPFEAALKLYMLNDPKQYRNMLDNLRFAVEQMLQTVLKNGKTLENQKSEFQLWLKSHGVHGNIGGMYHTLLFGYFTQYQNDAVKHHEDDYTTSEVEFVLYVTGTFLRLIQRLLEQKAAT